MGEPLLPCKTNNISETKKVVIMTRLANHDPEKVNHAPSMDLSHSLLVYMHVSAIGKKTRQLKSRNKRSNLCACHYRCQRKICNIELLMCIIMGTDCESISQLACTGHADLPR